MTSTSNEMQPIVMCKCKIKCPAKKLVSKKENDNKGREFYSCAKIGNDSCNYFQWADGNKRSFHATSSSSSLSSRLQKSSSHTLIDDNKVLDEAYYVIYTDGACKGNANVALHAWPCGWAAVVLRHHMSSELHVHRELYGPVELNPRAEDYLGAEVTSNNTAELCGIGEALRWLRDMNPEHHSPAVIRYDSEYAANSVQGLYKSKKNKALIDRVQALLREVKARGVQVVFLHVKGHSNELWNDRADALANLGATGVRSGRAGISYDLFESSKVDEANTPSKRLRSSYHA